MNVHFLSFFPVNLSNKSVLVYLEWYIHRFLSLLEFLHLITIG